MTTMRIVQEVIDHGDTHRVRYVPTDLTVDSVAAMLSDCVYRVALTPEKSERVAHELDSAGVSEVGWVTYRVLRCEHRTVALAAGFTVPFVDEALS